MAPVAEEILFRGFVHGKLRALWGFAPAAVLSSAVFALVHQVPVVLLPIFCIGFLLGYVYERTGSLYYCMLFHAGFNGSQLLVVVAQTLGSG